MDLGSRSIRSAGAGSGSIEVTLPAPLRDLQGLACRIGLRDGLRPEIVLQPDLRLARDGFARLQARLDAGFGRPATEPPLGALVLTLLPMPARPGPPCLAWTDGLALAAPPPQATAPLARSLRGLAEPLGLAAGLAPGLAPGFAAATAWLLAGRPPAAAEQADCEIACSALAAAAPLPANLALPADAFDAAAWAAATPWLRQLLALHRGWSAEPERHAALAAARSGG